MRTVVKSIISFAVLIVMLLGIIPSAVYADLLDNTPETNETILNELENVFGNNEDAEAYYDIMEEYGLLDDDGNLLQNKKIVVEGNTYTLLQLRSLLAQDFDDEKLAYVDGTPITLGNLKTILDIEDYISYIRENYVFEDDWTEEQKDNFSNWITALENGNVSLVRQTDASLKGNYSGVNHGAIVTFTAETASNANKSGSVKAQLSGAEEGQSVTFEYAFVSATAKSADCTFKTATLTADGDGQAECSLSFTTETLTIDELYTDGLPLIYLQARNITNALFLNGETATTYAVSMEPTVSGELNFAPPETFEFYATYSTTLDFPSVLNNVNQYINKKNSNGNQPDITVNDAVSLNTVSKAGDYAIRQGWLTIMDIADFTYYEYRDRESEDKDQLNIYAYLGPEKKRTGVVDLKINNLLNRSDGRLDECNTYWLGSSRTINKEYYSEYPMLTYQLTYWYFYIPECAKGWHLDAAPLLIRFKFSDGLNPNASASVTDVNYSEGQDIPVIMTYTEPVKIETASVVINGNTLYPEEKSMEGATQATALTFLYPAEKLYDEEILTVSAATAKDLTGRDLNWSEQILENINVLKRDKIHSFTESTGTLDETDPANPVLNVSLGISDNIALIQWLASDLDENGVSKTLSAVVSDTERASFALEGENIAGGTLTASVPLTRGTEDRNCTLELYDGDMLITQYLESFTLDKLKYLTEDSISTAVVVKNAEGGFYICDDPENPVIYVQDSPIVSARFELDDTDYSFGDITDVTCFDGEKLEREDAMFAWKSSDTSIAVINEEGKVTPTGKPGTVYFILYAFNGGSAEKMILTETESITFGVGLTPFIVMPNNSLTAGSGNILRVYWSSNIPDKQDNTQFTFSVKCGDKTVYETQTSGFVAEIPGDVLAYDYNDSSKNFFEISVSTQYLDKEYSARGTVMLLPAPAQASLSRPDSYYITDSTDSVSVSYLVSGLSTEDFGTQNLFDLRITRNSDVVLELTNPGTGNDGIYTDTLEIPIKDVTASTENPTSYRDVYTVSLQARNGTDSTWSCDSYVFYVYDTDALKLVLNGKTAGERETVTNEPEIAAMTQEEIIALKRVITLDDPLSINYDDYAWTDISDRMTWQSSDSSVAAIRYKEGSLRENIENTSYTCFLPITEFDLTGIEEGEAQISVTHMLTGMSDETTVTVETLENKLYLFSCTPATTTTIQYTNGAGENCTVTSDAKGQAAIYEETGITGDLYFTSRYGMDYTGTLSSDDLVSGEGKTSGSSLYPCNNFTLCPTAYAYIYLKDTDGSRYTKPVTLRGGVYLNGTYLPDALFGTGEGSAAVNRGDSDITVTPDGYGMIAITMDTTQWGIEGGMPERSDQIEYMFEITSTEADKYYPLIITLDTGMNPSEYVSSGNASVSMRENTGNGKAPFIYRQEMNQQSPANGLSETVNLLDSTECTGLSDIFTEGAMTLGIMWWGEENAVTISGSLDTSAGKSVGSFKSVSELKNCPFLHSGITILSFDVDESIAETAGIGASPVTLRLNWTQSDGKQIGRDLSFTFSNSIDQAENISTLGNEKIENAVASLKKLDTNFNSDTGDSYVKSILKFFASDDYTALDKDKFALQFVGTKDPHVFYLFMSIGLGSMSSSNVTGVYAIDQNNSAKGKFSYGPGWKETKLLFNRSLSKYKDGLKNEYNKAKSSKTMVGYEWKVSGYLQLKLTCKDDYKMYWVGIDGNIGIESDRWESEVVSGGFNGGFGLKFTKYFNTMVGPVPITAELAAGGTVELTFDALTMKYILENGDIEKGNEYLTQLRFYIYAYFFGGLGIDYSVVALKIGAFGQLSLDITAKWLNREYFYDDVEDVYYSDGDKVNNTDGKLNGQYIRIDGQIGIRFKAKLLFLKYEKILCSYPFNLLDKKFNDWNDVTNVWKTSQDKSKAAVNSLMTTSYASMTTVNGESYLSIDYLPTTEDFAYLSQGTRCWAGHTVSPLSLNSKKLEVMQSNAYPFSQPVVSDDGEIMVYLSDSNGETGAVQTAYALKNGDGYTDKGLITKDGLDDSSCAVAGTKDFAVATWYSLGKETKKDAGSIVTPEEQMIMLESSEVTAAIYKNGTWTTTELTDNSWADIAPVVAVSGEKAIVAWRSVATSHVSGNIADFDLKDEIHYRVYGNGTWSDEATLYNGTGGNVKGLNAAMLEDGTAAVIYCIDNDGDDGTSTDREIQWTLIGADGSLKRTVQATSDETADENPQITTVNIKGSERFVAAWNSKQNDQHDVRLADFDDNGVMTLNLPQTVSSASEDGSVAVGADFCIVKGADDLTDLSLLWAERNESETEKIYPGDSLKAVRMYYRNNGTVGVSTAQTLADAEDYVSIESIDAYIQDDVIYTVSLCTEYNENKLVKYSGMTQTGDTVDAYVADSTSFIATSVCKFSDGFSVESINYDTDGLKCGHDILTEFVIRNTGLHTINKLEIKVGENVTVIDNLELTSGQTGIYYADYSVPSDSLRDEDYVIKAYTEEGSESSSGTIPFGMSDVCISSAKIVAEKNGKRTIEVKLYDDTDYALNSNDGVVVRFCRDALGEQELRRVIIRDEASLHMIDEGGFCMREVFDMKDFADPNSGELPESGVNIHILVDVVNNENESINIGGEKQETVTFRSLADRTGTDVSIDTEFIPESKGSKVKVSVRNNYLSKTQTGNLIVSLLDKNGKIIAQKQSYDRTADNYGLITLGGEETVEFNYAFSLAGTSIDVRFEKFEPIKKAEDDDSAELSVFALTALPELAVDSFDSTANNTYKAKAYIKNANTVSCILMAKSVNAKITYRNKKVNGSITLNVGPGTNLYTFRVTSGNGKVYSEYTLELVNDGKSLIFKYPVVIKPTTATDKDTDTEDPVVVACKQDDTCVYAKYTDSDTNAWYHDGVHFCVENNYMNGISDNKFAPAGLISRAMIVTILWRMEDCPTVDYAMFFADVYEDMWYTEAIRWAQSTGIVNGYNDTRFGTADYATREQLAAILWRYAKHKNYDVSLGEDTNILSYDDAIGGVSEWAVSAMQWAVGAGIINGIDNKLKAADRATRAQTACMIQRFITEMVE